MKTPHIVIYSRAPIRICDNGGWTDTWFAKYGEVCNIAVSPFVEVQLAVAEAGDQPGQIIINAENFGDHYVFDRNDAWGKHPLIEAAIYSMQLPQDLSIEIRIHSTMPAGASTGTSAAVVVALIGALDQLTPGRMTAHELASAAQRIETDILGQQCGIQDQLCSTYGGINYIEMYEYPFSTVTPIDLSDQLLQEIERRLVLIYLGKSHSSTEIHERVIRSLEDAGPDCKKLADLRTAARKSKEALLSGDMITFGEVMIKNTEAQARLHPALIGSAAVEVIEIARKFGAAGWKVNGAGGEGGSVTIFCNERSDVKRGMLREIEKHNKSYSSIPINLSKDGLQVWSCHPDMNFR